MSAGPSPIVAARAPAPSLSAEDRLRRFEALARALATAHSTREVAAVLAREAALAVGAIAAVVMSTVDVPDVLELMGSHGIAPERASASSRLRVDAGHPVCRSFTTGEAEWLDDRDDHAATTREHADSLMAHAQALASFPMLVEGRTVGAVGLGFESARARDNGERAFIQNLLDLGAQAFERARLLDSERAARAAAERSSVRTAGLAKVTSELSRAVSPQEVAAVAVRGVREVLDTSAGAVLWLDDDALLPLHDSGHPELGPPEGARIALSVAAPMTAAVRTRQPQYFTNAGGSGASATEATSDDAAWLPLRARGRVLGAFGARFGDPSALSPEDRELLEAIAEACAQALERTRLYEREREARNAAERLGVFLEAGEAVARAGDRVSIVTRLTEVIVPALADCCVVDLLDDGGAPALAAVTNRDPAKVAVVRELRVRRPIETTDDAGVGAVLRTGTPEVYTHVTEQVASQLSDGAELELWTRLDVRSLLIVPIAVGERVLGALTVASSRDDLRYDVSDARLATKLASRAAFALDKARLIRELRAHADTERVARERAQLAARHMRVLAEASRAFSEARLDVHRIATSLATLVGAHLADGGIVCFVSEDGSHLEPVALRHADPDRQRAVDEALGRERLRIGEGILGKVAETGEPIVLGDAGASGQPDPSIDPYLAKLEPTAMVAVPLRLGGRVIGAVGAVRNSGASYDGDDVAFVQDLADRASIALANARLHGAEQIARKHVERLQSVTSALGEAISPEQVAAVILDSAMQELGGDHALYFEPSARGTELVCRQSRNVHDELGGDARVLAADRGGPVWDAFRSGSPIFVEQADHDERLPPGAESAPGWMTRGAFAVFPLVVGAGSVHGCVVVSFRQARTFSAVDRAFAMNLAEQSAQALDRARLYAGERAAKREAEDASRLKDEFLATVSHELRTPLNAILGWASMLRSGRLDSDAMERALTTIERNARAQARLVEDVLDVSRIISGKLAIRTEPVDVSAILAQALDVVRPAALAKELTIAHMVTPGQRVRGDADRLQQVYWNVLSNAVKFTSRGGSIAVRSFARDGFVVVSVTDSGRGVRPEFLPHMFEPFRQADGSTTRTHGGLGLGLSIARHLVQLHGGHIEATSDGEGLGSTFTISIPETRDASPRSASIPHRPAARLRGLDVLVVDDEDDARELAAMVLSAEGANVRTAASAREAISAIRAQTPAVLVCDIGMPEEDGLSLLPRARAVTASRGEHFAALAFTAYADADHAELVDAAGFDGRLTKPVDVPSLVSAIALLASSPTSSCDGQPE